MGKCPQQESNLRLCLRRATLYPLSYGGHWDDCTGKETRNAIPLHGME